MTELDFSDKLKENNLRLVQISNWQKEKNEVNGFSKVVPIETYPGIFADVDGSLHDMRPS